MMSPSWKEPGNMKYCHSTTYLGAWSTTPGSRQATPARMWRLLPNPTRQIMPTLPTLPSLPTYSGHSFRNAKCEAASAPTSSCTLYFSTSPSAPDIGVYFCEHSSLRFIPSALGGFAMASVRHALFSVYLRPEVDS